MSEIEDVYTLERIDQLRAVADEFRQRIFQVLTARPMTVTQVGDMLGHAPAKILYHVRELERVGLVRLVEKRERGGILEKYYRAVAQRLRVPPSLLTGPSSDEQVAAVESLLQDVSMGLAQALSPRMEGGDKHALFMRASAWMTDKEARALVAQIDALLDAYIVPRGLEGERELLISTLLYEPQPDTTIESNVLQTGEVDPPVM